MHPEGGCSFCRWGTYFRLVPLECEIARFYCRESRTTFSVLPDCLAARMPGTVQQLEQASLAVEQGKKQGPLEVQAQKLRTTSHHGEPIEPRSAVRWMMRRHHAVTLCLTVLITLMPQVFGSCVPTLASVGAKLSGVWGQCVLMGIRHVAQGLLDKIPSPVGYSQSFGTNKACGSQHQERVFSSDHTARGVETGAESWKIKITKKERGPPT